MNKITFILGGARSGKSSYAVEMAKKQHKKVAFIATCARSAPLDKEMKKRIELHKRKRPSHWQTFEEEKDISSLLRKISSKYNVVIIDCLTLLISSLLGEGLDDNAIENKVNKILKVLKLQKYKSIIVSNEVGLGIVPGNRMARRFRDLAGRINQSVSQEADDVFFMTSGIPLKVKGGRKWKR